MSTSKLLDNMSNIVFTRTYARPKEDGTLETVKDAIERVIFHQKWLWERQQNMPLNPDQESELNELKYHMLNKNIMCAGRTFWLGGTDKSRECEATQFNCSVENASDVYSLVNIYWLLLQGCGVGFTPTTGNLFGFSKHIELSIIRSNRIDKSGIDENEEKYDPNTGLWIIKVGDSARAWAKYIGKLLIHKYPANKLVVSFANVRPAGERLKGYGWICSGDKFLAEATQKIVDILNNRIQKTLTKLDILDIVTLLGTTLSSRRSALLSGVEYGSDEWESFALAKKNIDGTGKYNRYQSNNSLIFNYKPRKDEIKNILDMMVYAGGSEPGILNAEAARKRFPFFKVTNPCGEILLNYQMFCNLFEVNTSKRHSINVWLRIFYLTGRANYRQTCVNLNDGILTENWHYNNDFFRLCGSGITGVVQSNLTDNEFKRCSNAAILGANMQATEFGTNPPYNVTTIKPSGTMSLYFGCTPGVHMPLGKYIFRNVLIPNSHPLLDTMLKAGYKKHSYTPHGDSTLMIIPIQWDNIKFGERDGLLVDTESAVTQLERYKFFMSNYCQNNVSSTISYNLDEIPEICEWLYKNWDNTIGVSFIQRQKPNEGNGEYPYLPNEIVDKDTFEEYASNIKELSLTNKGYIIDDLDEECSGGACPIR